MQKSDFVALSRTTFNFKLAGSKYLNYFKTRTMKVILNTLSPNSAFSGTGQLYKNANGSITSRFR